MKLTKKFKAWVVANCGVAADAADSEFEKAALKALGENKLTLAKIAELSAPDEEEVDPFKQIGELVSSSVSGALAPVIDRIAAIEKNVAAAGTGGSSEGKKTEGEQKTAKTADEILDEKIQEAVSKIVGSSEIDVAIASRGPSPVKLFGDRQLPDASGSGASGEPRVKSPIERYSQTKSAAMYGSDYKHAHMRDMPIVYGGKHLETQSQADLAVIGAFVKFRAHKTMNPGAGSVRFTEHDQQLVKYALNELPWTGFIGSTKDNDGLMIDGRKLSDFEKKALLDDATSGGLEAVPIVFDDAVITVPLLFGELFPLVNVIPLTRGRRVEGAAFGNVTIGASTEGTAIDLFNTDNFISAFDNTIFVVAGSMELGNDFQQDSPVSVGSIVVNEFGKAYMVWLDNQIANGDGTTEPQGVFNATGITDIGNPTGGAGAAPQITDYETLLFGIGKQFRTPDTRGRQVFIGNDTTYRRARSIAVGSNDARRVFGMTHEDYSLLGHPFKIQNNIANTHAGFFNLAHYRMYRRLGLNLKVETGGKTLALANKTLIVCRARFGGKLEQGGAGAYTDNMQT